MNLYDTVTKDAMSRRLGDVILLTFGRGQGALIADSVDFMQARKWGEQRQASGNEQRDFQLWLNQIEAFVPRYGSGLAAKGGMSRLLRLARSMQMAGLNHEDWAFPRDVADELRKHPSVASAQIEDKTETEEKPDDDGEASVQKSE